MIAPSRDTHTNWNDKDPVILEGVLGFTKNRIFDGSLEYFVGDGVHRYSELPKYGGAEASTSKKNYTLVLRDGNGKIDSASLPDATPTSAGAVKASTTVAPDTVVKADSNGSLDGWRTAISNAIADPNAGLVVGSDGKLNVDFDQMPTDKFEALLKSLKMLVPLTANMDLYVDTNSSAAGDTIIDGRGTEAKPFKTIQACVNFVTSTYAVGNYIVTIHVCSGTYNESVTLPDFSRGQGYIKIITNTGLKDVIVNAALNSAGTRLHNFAALGGMWEIHNIDARRIENPTTDLYPIASCYGASGGNTVLSLFGISASQTLPSNASALTGEVRLINPDNGGTIRLYPSANPMVISTEKPGSGTLKVYAIRAMRGGVITLYRDGNNANITNAVNCSGSCNTFIDLAQNSKLNNTGVGNMLSFTGTVTGTRYSVSDGSSVSLGVSVSDASTYFPGDTAGTVDTDTYSWYK